YSKADLRADLLASVGNMPRSQSVKSSLRMNPLRSADQRGLGIKPLNRGVLSGSASLACQIHQPSNSLSGALILVPRRELQKKGLGTFSLGWRRVNVHLPPGPPTRSTTCLLRERVVTRVLAS